MEAFRTPGTGSSESPSIKKAARLGRPWSPPAEEDARDHQDEEDEDEGDEDEEDEEDDEDFGEPSPAPDSGEPLPDDESSKMFSGSAMSAV